MTTKDILDKVQHKSFIRRGNYCNWVKRQIVRAGYKPLVARYDEAGNCIYCGEAGRCPGWHTEDEVSERCFDSQSEGNLMKVQLSCASNPDIRDMGGFWTDMERPKKPVFVEVADYKDASTKCLEFIERYELGGGNWTGGKIVDEKGIQIGRCSYNGKLWDMQDNEIT